MKISQEDGILKKSGVEYLVLSQENMPKGIDQLVRFS